MCCVARGCSSGQGRAGPAPVGLVSTGIKTPPRTPREGRIDKQQEGGREIRRKRRPGGENTSCQGPEAGMSLVSSRNREEQGRWNTRTEKFGGRQREFLDQGGPTPSKVIPIFPGTLFLLLQWDISLSSGAQPASKSGPSTAGLCLPSLSLLSSVFRRLTHQAGHQIRWQRQPGSWKT